MSLSQDEIKSIGQQTGKKVVIQAKCKERADFVLGEIKDVREHELSIYNAARPEVTREKAKKMLTADLVSAIDTVKEVYPDIPVKSILLKDLELIKYNVDSSGNSKDAIILEAAEGFRTLQGKLFDVMLEDFKQCECDAPAVASKKLPTRSQVRVDVWEERDRLSIAVVDKDTDKAIVEWWDEDARQMFEDGFFKPGIVHGQLSQSADRNLTESVLEYAEDMGFIAK